MKYTILYNDIHDHTRHETDGYTIENGFIHYVAIYYVVREKNTAIERWVKNVSIPISRIISITSGERRCEEENHEHN